jgi:RNA polymerase primary sigma factor
MKFNKEKIQSYSTNELYTQLLPIITKIYSVYSYADIDEETSKKIALIAIKDSVEKIEDFEKFNKIFSLILVEHTNKYIKSLFQDQERGVTLVENFVKTNLEVPKSPKNALKELQKLTTFFKEINYFPPPELYIELIKKIPILNDLLKDIVDTNLNLVKDNKINVIFNDDIFTSFIEFYCMINGINIEDEEFYSQFKLDNEFLVYVRDGVNLYLQEISKPLLSPKEEIELFYRMQAGEQKAREILIERNLRLVVRIAKNYINLSDLTFSDLIQEGNIGLIKSISKFDVTKGYRFSTYATYNIKNEIQQAVYNRGRNIRVPVEKMKAIGKYLQVQEKLGIKLNREPTIEEIAKELGITLKKVKELEKLQNGTISLNELVSDDSETELGDFIPASSGEIDDNLLALELQEQVQKLFEECRLSEKEIEILMLRYGFNGISPKTLREIAEKYNYSVEGVRKTELTALKKIRNSDYIKTLAIFTSYPSKSLERIETFRNNGNKSYIKSK